MSRTRRFEVECRQLAEDSSGAVAADVPRLLACLSVRIAKGKGIGKSNICSRSDRIVAEGIHDSDVRELRNSVSFVSLLNMVESVSTHVALCLSSSRATLSAVPDFKLAC